MISFESGTQKIPTVTLSLFHDIIVPISLSSFLERRHISLPFSGVYLFGARGYEEC